MQLLQNLGDKDMFVVLRAALNSRIEGEQMRVRGDLSDVARRLCALIYLTVPVPNKGNLWVFESPAAVTQSRGLLSDSLFELGWVDIGRTPDEATESDFSRLLSRMMKEGTFSSSNSPDDFAGFYFDGQFVQPLRERRVHGFYAHLSESAEVFEEGRDAVMLGKLCMHLKVEHWWALLSAIRVKNGQLGRKALLVSLETVFGLNVKLESQKMERGNYRSGLDTAWSLARRRPRLDLVQYLILSVLAMEEEEIKMLGSRLVEICEEFGSAEPV